MRISKLFLVAVGMIWMAACSPDWGQHDPEAGNQTYPSREVVATYSFEYSDETPVFSDVDRTLSLKTCEVVEVDTFGSNVLHLDSGYVRINNPLNNVTLQDGAAITMWVNIANEDLEKALFSFGYDEEDSAKFYFTPNAQLVYSKPGQLESLNLNVNDPSSVKTNAIDADGQWHFIALQVADDGYQFYVDGELKANDTQQHPTYSTDFDYKTLLNHINNAPYLYIGAGADTLMSEVYYDDITLIRNHMQEKDWNKTFTPKNNGGDVAYSFPPEDILGWYKLDGNFNNAINSNNTGNLITSETQGTVSSFETDAVRGTVWHQVEGWAGHTNGYAYSEFSNPLAGASLTSGVTISLWIKQPTVNWWDTTISFFDGTARLWFNGNGYLGFNDGVGNWFDCQQSNGDNAIPADEWTMVTMTFTSDGFIVYYNGEEKFTQSANGAYNSSGMSDYSLVSNLVAGSSKFYLGYGSFWGAANTYVDDIMLIPHSMSATEVANLYADTNKSNGGAPVSPNYAPELAGYYPLSGSFANALNSSQSGNLVTSETQSTVSSFETDAVRGTVWHQVEGWAGHDNGYAYTEFTNPLANKSNADGASFSFWLRQPTVNWWDTTISFFDGTARLWFNGNGYLGFNDGTGNWFDCQQSNGDNAIPADEWTLVTISFTPETFTVYYNGEEKFSNENYGAYNSSGMTDFSLPANLMYSSSKFYMGYGSFWGAANSYISDVYLCASPMTAAQAKALYNATVK